MPQAYRVLKDRILRDSVCAKAGDIVYSAGYDYGLASDDTRYSGIEHISVTLKRNGGPSSFTIPLRDLEECEAPPLENLTMDHIKSVCRPGAGAETCRYLVMAADGFECAKHMSIADTLDDRVRIGTIVARGDNCEGRQGHV